ncbi:MAG: hypothetical protein WAM53_15210, partial [Terrimicrobiaceae bacterium]
MHISVSIELPADEWEEARQKVAMHPIYTGFREALNSAGIKFDDKLETFETRAKPAASAPGAKRGRKAKVPVFADVIQADPHVMDAVRRASTEELPEDAA